MNWIQKIQERGPSTVCGLSFNAGHAHAVTVEKLNGTIRTARATASIPFDLDAEGDDPETRGRELRTKLDAAQVVENRVAVVVPLKWVMTSQIVAPNVGPEDLQSFLELQVEQEFPLPPGEVAWSHCLVPTPDGATLATLAGVPRTKLDRLDRILAAAGLQVVSVSLGLSRARESLVAGDRAAVNLWFAANAVGVEIRSESDVIGLRWIEDATTATPAQSGETDSDHGGNAGRLDDALLFRELRISLGQVPAAIRQGIRTLRLWGPDASVEAFRTVLGARLRNLGIVHLEAGQLPEGADGSVTDRGAVYAAWGAAADRLENQRRSFELLPPKVNRFQQILDRVGTGSNRGRIGIGIAVLALAALTFWYQGHKLARLERIWAELEPDATEVDAIQAKIRQFRPWFSSRAESLEITEHLTRAFPEEGSVWARNLEIRDNGKVFCAGLAKDSESLLGMLDELRAMPQVSELTVQQVRGEGQVQFAFGYSWNTNPAADDARPAQETAGTEGGNND